MTRQTSIRIFVLDTVLTDLAGYDGPVYGVRRTDGAGQTLVIARTKPGAGLVPVASTVPDVLPFLARNRLGQWTCAGVPVEILAYAHDYTARHAGLVDPSVIARKRGVIVGLGSVGMPLALYLARAGIGSIALVDADTVGLVNLTRSGYEATDIGREKVLAAAERIVAANPGTNVRAIPHAFPAAYDIEPDAFDGADLIVAAASNAVGFSLAERFHRTTPIVFPALHANAASGEVFVSLGSDHTERACFTCFRGAMRATDDGAPVAPDTGRTWNYSAPGQELAAEPGLGPDIGHVVAIAGALAVNILAETTDRVMDPERHLLLVSNRRGALFEQAYATSWVRVRPDPHCRNHTEPAPADPTELARLLASIPEAS